uniref:Uncharacterized protein n=1 Tax=Trichuris muris TaxID=70415 RepID=A0A5S6R549_TRIMR
MAQWSEAALRKRRPNNVKRVTNRSALHHTVEANGVCLEKAPTVHGRRGIPPDKRSFASVCPSFEQAAPVATMEHRRRSSAPLQLPASLPLGGRGPRSTPGNPGRWPASAGKEIPQQFDILFY